MLLFCLASILWFDRPLALWLKAHESETGREVFQWITRWGTPDYLLPFLVLAGLALALYHFCRREKGPILMPLLLSGAWIVLSLCVSGVLVHGLKFAAGRYRPTVLFSDGLYGFHPFSGATSFPSGHTQAAVAVCLPLMLMYPRFLVPGGVMIAAVAASRMVLGAHYLSDVVASVALTGLCVLWSGRKLSQWSAGGFPLKSY